MTAVAVALMGAGVALILATADLSGGTVLGCLVYLAGMYVAVSVHPRPARPRDSVDRAVDAEAAALVEGAHRG